MPIYGHRNSRDPWGKEQTHSWEDPYVHEVSLCVREPQTVPQAPRMGGHRVEKTGC